MSIDVADAGMLVLARESRGMTQIAVADRMSALGEERISQGYVSKAEAGRLAVSGERLTLYASAVGYPPDLLCVNAAVEGIGIGLVHHRKKAALGAQALRRLHAQLAICRIQSRRLLATEPASPHLFEHVPVTDLDSPEDAARSVRRQWGLPAGPVANLVEAVENAGGLILLRDLGTTDLDAASQWDGKEDPLFFLGDHAPGDRFRFTFAHEVGHVVMHGEPGSPAEQEREADRFAAEFLMPAADIRKDLTGPLELNRLAVLKQRWGVSMSALARRAHTLSAISEWQYRNLMVEMSALGYRAREPGQVDFEVPQRVRRALARLTDSHGVRDAAAIVGMLPSELCQLLETGPDAPGVHHR